MVSIMLRAWKSSYQLIFTAVLSAKVRLLKNATSLNVAFLIYRHHRWWGFVGVFGWIKTLINWISEVVELEIALKSHKTEHIFHNLLQSGSITTADSSWLSLSVIISQCIPLSIKNTERSIIMPCLKIPYVFFYLVGLLPDHLPIIDFYQLTKMNF